MLAYKNIYSTSNDTKKKHSNIYTLYFQNYYEYNHNQCKTVNKQCCLDLDAAYCVYLDISNLLKLPPLIHDSIDNMIIMYVID